MNKSTLQFSAHSSEPGFVLRWWLNSHDLGCVTLTAVPTTILIEFDNTPAQQHVVINLSGKCAQHTVLDEQGKITHDMLAKMQSFRLDGVPIDTIFFQRAKYVHDCNGTDRLDTHGFYGSAGCNGDIIFDFDTPTFRWLLDNLS